MRKYIFAASAALLGLAPLAAQAQDVPSYAQDQQGGGDEQIRGRVIGFDGAYAVTVRDDRGFVDNIELHQGTIINPTGITIAPGMVVSILGYNAGNVFDANEVDTPYTFDAGVPYYGGHPWNYYGPTIGFDFFFGNTGWWHGSYFNGPYRYNNGARIYANVNFNTIYRAGGYGQFSGRNYVQGVAHGGYAPGRAYPQGGAYTHNNYTHDNVTNYNSRTTNVYAPNTTRYNGNATQYNNANRYNNSGARPYNGTAQNGTARGGGAYTHATVQHGAGAPGGGARGSAGAGGGGHEGGGGHDGGGDHGGH